MANIVVAFAGNNANDILEVSSKKIMEYITVKGLACHVLDLKNLNFNIQLEELINKGILFGWGAAGIGAGLNINKESFWDKFNIPFISVHADPPFANPNNHRIPARNVINGYHFKEGADFQRDWICAPQISAMLPMAIVPIAERDKTPWSKRPRRMVFVKSGFDPKALRARWSDWPVKLRRVLEDSVDVLSKETTSDIVPLIFQCLAANGINLHGSKDILCSLMHEVDNYIRAFRATVMVAAVRNLDVDIFGDGWGHVSHLGGRARFWPSVNASVLNSLYADTQYLVNANPNFSSGLHERVLYGFAAKCCVVSDDNAFSRANLSHLPSYHGLEWTDKALSDRFGEIYSDASNYDDKLQPALDYVNKNHDPALLISTMFELAEITAKSHKFQHYMF